MSARANLGDQDVETGEQVKWSKDNPTSEPPIESGVSLLLGNFVDAKSL